MGIGRKKEIQERIYYIPQLSQDNIEEISLEYFNSLHSSSLNEIRHRQTDIRALN